MDQAREKLVRVLNNNQARYSCPELAKILRLSETGEVCPGKAAG